MKQNLKHNLESDSAPDRREGGATPAVSGGDTSAVLGGKVPPAPPSGHALPRDAGKGSQSLADMFAILSDKITALQNSTTERFAEQTEKIAELKTFTMEKFVALETKTMEKFAALEAKIANGQRDMIKWAATLFVGMIVVFSIVVDHIVDNSIKSHLANERATMQEMQATVQDMQVTMQDMQATIQQLVDEKEEP